MALTIDSVTGNSADASIDVSLSGAAIGTKVDIERRIVGASRDDARAFGVPEDEVVATYTVARNYTLTTGSAVWKDLSVRYGINYEVRARDVGFNTWTGWES